MSIVHCSCVTGELTVIINDWSILAATGFNRLKVTTSPINGSAMVSLNCWVRASCQAPHEKVTRFFLLSIYAEATWSYVGSRILTKNAAMERLQNSQSRLVLFLDYLQRLHWFGITVWTNLWEKLSAHNVMPRQALLLKIAYPCHHVRIQRRATVHAAGIWYFRMKAGQILPAAIEVCRTGSKSNARLHLTVAVRRQTSYTTASGNSLDYRLQ